MQLSKQLGIKYSTARFRFHDLDNIYDDDIAEIKEVINKFWQFLIFSQTKNLQVKH